MESGLEIIQVDALDSQEIYVYLSDGRSLFLTLDQLLKTEHREVRDEDLDEDAG